MLSIYNSQGKLVYSYSGITMDGNISWNTLDLAGNACKAGVYIYRFIGNNIKNTGTFCLTGNRGK
jgi:hypothetical protein